MLASVLANKVVCLFSYPVSNLFEYGIAFRVHFYLIVGDVVKTVHDFPMGIGHLVFIEFNHPNKLTVT